MFRIAPKSFNSVNVIPASIGKSLAVIDLVVLAQTFQGIIASEGVGIINRSFSRVRFDMSHELIGKDPIFYTHFLISPCP